LVTVNFSSALQSATKGSREVEIEFEGDVTMLIGKLSEIFGEEFSRRITENGSIRRYINVYVDGKDIRFSGGLHTAVRRDSVVDVVPAVSGG